MKNNLILILAVCFFTTASAQEVYLKANYTPKTNPGQRMLVEVIIYKNNLQRTGRFEQKLPDGFKAIEIKSDGGVFDFSNQTLSISWLRMPAKDSLRLNYYLEVPGDAVGMYSLGGKFSYQYDNMLGQTILEPSEFSVLKAVVSSGAARTQVAIDTLFPGVVRVKPYLMPDTALIQVKYLISKGDNTAIIQIQDKLPAGYIASPDLIGTGKFTMTTDQVKLEVNRFPTDNYFVMSYTLRPVAGFANQASVENLPEIKGDMYFFQGSNMRSLPITQGFKVDGTKKVQ